MSNQKGEAEVVALLAIFIACVVLGWLISDGFSRRECAKGTPKVIGEKVYVCVERE
jgi:hypothetical protein